MSCFNSVLVECHQCQEAQEFQLKAGDCIIKYYTDKEKIPVEIIENLQGESRRCSNGHDVIFPFHIVKMVLRLRDY